MRVLTSIFALSLLGSCQQPAEKAEKPEPKDKIAEPAKFDLPLSPGVKVASLVSGGIAGISDMVQVTWDGKLIVVTQSGTYIRRLGQDEQRALHESVKGFATLHHAEGQGPDVADGMSSVIVARGSGEGEGDAEDARLVGAALAKLLIVKPEPVAE